MDVQIEVNAHLEMFEEIGMIQMANQTGPKLLVLFCKSFGFFS